jgi:hypothetical protein
MKLSPPQLAVAACAVGLACAPGIGAAEPVVLDDGVAPDGSRYELTGQREQMRYRIRVDGRLRRERFDVFCLTLRWPEFPRRAGLGGTCAGRGEPAADTPYDEFAVRFVQARSEGVASRDVMVAGTADPAVRRVRVVYRDRAGADHELAVDSHRAAGDLRRRAGAFEPLLTFVAFLPGEVADADDFASRFGGRFDRVRIGLRIRAGEVEGPRRRARQGPLRLIAYDADGGVIDRRGTVVWPRLPARGARPRG